MLYIIVLYLYVPKWYAFGLWKLNFEKWKRQSFAQPVNFGRIRKSI